MKTPTQQDRLTTSSKVHPTAAAHEFIDALLHNRFPAMDVYEALAGIVPAQIARQSAL